MPYDTVQCLECGKWFASINNSHLKTHELTCGQYLRKYPGVKLTSESVSEKLSKSWKASWDNPESSFNTLEYREKLSKTRRGMWKDPESCFNSPEYRENHSKSVKKMERHEWREKLSKANMGHIAYRGSGTGRIGKRADLNNQFFRSTWEANMARIINFWGIKWEYEVKRIYYNNGHSHMIDFYLPETDSYLDIYAYLDKRHLEEFYGVYESGLSTQFIGPDVYKDLENEFKDKLPFWENGRDNIRTREKEKEMG